MLQLKLLNLLDQGKLERCKLVKQRMYLTTTDIVHKSNSNHHDCDVFSVQVVPVMLHLLTSISSVRLYIPKDLRPFDNRQLMLKSIQVL